MIAHLGLVLAVVGTVVVMLDAERRRVVDVIVKAVAIVAILGNVSVADVHVGRMCVAHSPSRASLAARTTPVTLVTGAGLFDQPRPDYTG